MKEKTYVEDIDRNIYDFKDDEKDAYKIKAGLTPEIVEQLSKEKHDPAWRFATLYFGAEQPSMK